MGFAIDLLSDLFNDGLKKINDEINAEAIEEGLVKAKDKQPESGEDRLRCRSDFAELYEQLTGETPNRNGGPS